MQPRRSDLLEEATAAGVEPAGGGNGGPTPFCDKMREIGQWNTAWDPFFELDSVWTDQFRVGESMRQIKTFIDRLFAVNLFALSL